MLHPLFSRKLRKRTVKNYYPVSLAVQNLTDGVPLRSVLGLMLCHVISGDPGRSGEYSCIKFVMIAIWREGMTYWRTGLPVRETLASWIHCLRGIF